MNDEFVRSSSTVLLWLCASYALLLFACCVWRNGIICHWTVC